jgi:hypothetical protein
VRAPVDSTRVLHIANWTSTAIMVDVTGRGGATPDGGAASAGDYVTAIRPCGGEVDLASDALPGADWVVWLLVDPSGAFDTALAEWTADPHDMPGTFNGATIIWSRGNVGAAGLPAWVLVNQFDIELLSSPFPPTPANTCGPLMLAG